jgi:O-antigen ligase
MYAFNRPLFHAQLYYIALLLIAATLPFLIHWNSIAVILLAANWLAEGNFRRKFRIMSQNRQLWIIAGFYGLYAAGLLYTTYLANGGAKMEQKMTFVLLPLIIATSDRKLTTRQWRNIFLVFAIACSVAVIFLLGYASYRYISSNDLRYFFYEDLSYRTPLDLHPVYFSLYLLFCLYILYFLFKDKWKFYSLKTRTGLGLWATLLVWMLVLLSSKTMLALLLLTVNVWLIRIFVSRKKWMPGLLVVVAASTVLILTLAAIPAVRERFQEILKPEMASVNETKFSPNTRFSGLSGRTAIWRFGMEILQKDNTFLWGLGTGDVQPALDSIYKVKDIYTGTKERGDTGFLGYNAHNQYIEMLLELGIPGLFYLFFLLGTGFHTALTTKNYLYFFFLLLFAFACLTESMLESQKGILFFNFFNSLFRFQKISAHDPPASPANRG